MASPQQIEDWYQRYGYVIYARCLRLLGHREAAADAVQDIFAILLDKGPTHFWRKSPLPWLNRVTTRYCLDRLAEAPRARAYRDAVRVHAAEAAPAPDAQLAARQLLAQNLAHEDERTQAIVAALYLEGMSQEELAERLGISTRAIRKRLARFRARFEPAPLDAAGDLAPCPD